MSLAFRWDMPRLLLVDDEEDLLAGLRRSLAASGYEVDCASEREEAEALVRHVAYDALILDLSLTPGCGPDGLAVITSAREHCPRARILILSGESAAETQAHARRLGADCFLVKPQTLPNLLTTLGRLLGSRS